MPKWTMPHAEAMMNHAIRRLFQRHGIIISIAEYKALTDQCADGTAPPLGIGSHEGTFHRVTFRKRDLWLVYRHDQRAVVSFYPGEPAIMRRQREQREQQQARASKAFSGDAPLS